MRSGFEAANGIYFIKFDDDDALTPEFLAKTVAVLESQPTVDFVCTNRWIIDRHEERIKSATEENAAKWGKDKLQESIIPDLLVQTFQYQSLQVGSTLFVATVWHRSILCVQKLMNARILIYQSG